MECKAMEPKMWKSLSMEEVMEVAESLPKIKVVAEGSQEMLVKFFSRFDADMRNDLTVCDGTLKIEGNKLEFSLLDHRQVREEVERRERAINR